MMRLIAVLWSLFLCMVSLGAEASATIYNVSCSGDITSTLTSAIHSAVNGDTINISAGSCSMNNIGLINTNITIQGAGKGVTVITADHGFGQMVSPGATVPSWRLTGFTLTSTLNVGALPLVVWADQAAVYRGGFRIDHINFNYPNSGANVYIFGPTYGLIDHSDFTGAFESAILTGLQLTSTLEDGSSISKLKGGFGASIPYFPGGPTNLYIEDNTFTGTTAAGIAATDTGYSGGRIVFRHNTLVNATMYSHWTSAGSVNSLWWEIYNNSFTWNSTVSMFPFRLQGGGTGLIYNNTIIGFQQNFIVLGEGRLTSEGQSGPPLLFCDGTHNWDGNAGDSKAPGWPCLGQTGRNAGVSIASIQAGVKQTSFPLYVWNNGPQASCSNPSQGGPPCDNSFGVNVRDLNWFNSIPHVTPGFGKGDVDYSVSASQPTGAGTHTLTYTPYPYPYVPKASHDFDGDGQSDIAWRDTSGNTAVWLMNGAQLAQSAGVGAAPATWSVVGQRDFDGDGKHDWLWRDTGGNVALWFLSGAQVKQVVGVGNVPMTWSVVGTADFNGDRKGDILWRDTSGNVAIWLMDGAQVIQSAGSGSAPAAWSVVGIGDFDGDGKSDILWRDTSGNVAIWFMNGVQITRSAGIGNVPTAWSVVGTGDFDGNGKSDILWRDTSGNIAIWLMNGAQPVETSGVGMAPNTWSIAETGDYNGDGRSDILWRDASGNVAIWFMNGLQITQSSAVGNAPIAWSIQGANVD